MRSVTGFRAALHFLTILAFAASPAPAVDPEPDDTRLASEQRVEPGHEETPVRPPLAPVLREHQPRSPRTIVMRGLHTSVQVNVDALQNNIVGDAANEPSIAVDPTNPTTSSSAGDSSTRSPRTIRQAGYGLQSRRRRDVDLSRGSLDPGQFRSDPVLAADSLGNFLLLQHQLGDHGEYFISTDKGVNWSGPISAPAGDKNWHIIDITGGQGDGTSTDLELAVHLLRGGDRLLALDGRHGELRRAVRPAAASEVGHRRRGSRRRVVHRRRHARPELGAPVLRSDNADNALSTPTSAWPRTSTSAARRVQRRHRPTRGDCSDRSGSPSTVRAARPRQRLRAGSVDPPADPIPSTSTSSAARTAEQSWSAPLRVNDDPGTTVLPVVRDDVGRPRRADRRGVERHAQRSRRRCRSCTTPTPPDAGTTFSAGLPVSPPFDSTVGHPVQNKIGDYYHMVSDTPTRSLAYSATFNGEQDVYFIRVGDCNANGQHDSIDIAQAFHADLNANGILDACEPDCNGNGTPDEIDLTNGTSDDCNANSIPDECDISGGQSGDCDEDGTPDECDVDDRSRVRPGFRGRRGRTTTRRRACGCGSTRSARRPSPRTTTRRIAGTRLLRHRPGGASAADSGDNDVDGGKTTLYSTTLDLSGDGRSRAIGYWRWYSNDTGGAPNEDVFTVDVSEDGGDSWENVEIVGPAGAPNVRRSAARRAGARPLVRKRPHSSPLRTPPALRSWAAVRSGPSSTGAARSRGPLRARARRPEPPTAPRRNDRSHCAPKKRPQLEGALAGSARRKPSAELPSRRATPRRDRSMPRESGYPTRTTARCSRASRPHHRGARAGSVH